MSCTHYLAKHSLTKRGTNKCGFWNCSLYVPIPKTTTLIYYTMPVEKYFQKIFFGYGEGDFGKISTVVRSKYKKY